MHHALTVIVSDREGLAPAFVAVPLPEGIQEGDAAAPAADASPGRWSRWSGQVRGWLERRAHPDEALLVRLASATTLAVRHPPGWTFEEAADVWSSFAARARRRHRRGLLLNLLVSPLTVLLAPLPGPNFVGYWFVYRAWRHGRILFGLRRLRRGLLVPAFLPVDSDSIPTPYARLLAG